MELVVWAGGRWRRVCPASGRVCGWRRRARLVAARGGCLRELPAAALRRLRRGPRVPALRSGDIKPKMKVPLARPAAAALNHRYKKSEKTRQPSRRDAGVQTDSECAQHAAVPRIPAYRPHTNTIATNTDRYEHEENAGGPKKRSRIIRSTSSASTEILEVRKPTKEPERQPSGPQTAEHPFINDNEKCTNNKDKSQPSQSQNSKEDQFPVKELIINEEDVLLLRTYIKRNNTSIDLDRFDTDDQYKMYIFFKINPLVRLERCPRIEQMMRDRDNPQATAQFARQLGLRSVADSDSEREKRRRVRAVKGKKKLIENNSESGSDSDLFTLERYVKSRKRRRVDSNAENRRPAQTAACQVPKPSSVMPRKRPGFAPKRSSVPAGREYSSLEDQAIVAWLSAAAARERGVNGNAVWRELQPQYHALTGQSRSWHSLRNRYLRYILPALGSLALPPQQARRLRAHASLGSLKARRAARRNSALQLPAVTSAHARRPRPARSPTPATQDTTQPRSSPPSPPPRALRSSLRRASPAPPRVSPSPPAPRAPPSPPSYAELTRRFALRHRSTPQDAPSTTPPPPSREASRVAPSRRRLYNPAA